MAIYYNLSNLTAANEPYSWFVALNLLTDYKLGIFIWVILYFMIFMGLKNFNEIEETFAATSFVTAIFGFMMLAMNMLPTTFVYLSVVLVGLGGFVLWIKGKG